MIGYSVPIPGEWAEELLHNHGIRIMHPAGICHHATWVSRYLGMDNHIFGLVILGIFDLLWGLGVQRVVCHFSSSTSHRATEVDRISFSLVLIFSPSSTRGKKKNMIPSSHQMTA